MQSRNYDDYDDEYGNQEQDEQQQEKQMIYQSKQLEKIIENKSTILLARTHDNSQGTGDCSYCKGIRETFNGKEDELKSFKSGFSSTKFRTDDYEQILNAGYSRSGTYFYHRDYVQSCCEPFQYRVDADKFKPSDSQRKAIKRFHNYLNYGSVKGKQEQEESKHEDIKMKDLSKQIDKIQSIQPEQLNYYKQLIEKEISNLINQMSLKQINQQHHKIIYNSKFQCISSNIFFIGGDLNSESQQILIERLKEQIKELKWSQVSIDNKFLNFKEQMIAIEIKQKKSEKQKIKQLKKSDKKQIKEEQKVQSLNDKNYQYPPNHYKNYVIEYNPSDSLLQHEPAHIYTIEIHPAIFTEELFQMYQKYEKAVHKRDRDAENLTRFLCNSPIYDPVENIQMAFSASLPQFKGIDQNFRKFEDLGVYPGQGTFHMYHRIDGQLVACNVIDILNEVYVSAYCIYDPDMSFLSLGIVTAIREFEYMRLIKQKHNPQLKWYQLGELVVTCAKLNYKLNYGPGYMICPRTKKNVPIERCLEQINLISKMPLEEKKNLPYIQLADDVDEKPLENELLPQVLKHYIQRFPFIYEDTQWLSLQSLNAKGRVMIASALQQLLMHCGFDLFGKFHYELKYPQEEPKVPDTEQKKEENEQQNQERQAEQQIQT